MINKNNYRAYLQTIVSARIKLIEAIKDDIRIYDGEVADLMAIYEDEVCFDDHKRISDLYRVEVPKRIFEVCDCEPDFIEPVGSFERRGFIIDGIICFALCEVRK